MDYDLGFFDKDEGRIEPGPYPFGPDKVLTMCPEQGVNHVTCQFRHLSAVENHRILPKSDR